MTDYAIGDIQGCYRGLRQILDAVDFDPAIDRLIATGDLINRGPDSLDTLRFCRDLGTRFKTVLGNHDLHLLAIAHGVRKPTRHDTLDAVLAAPDRELLLDWLQRQPLLLDVGDYTLVHAGIPPQWSLSQARALAAEVSEVLCSARAGEYFEGMYGNQPERWSESLRGVERWRCITNYLTRMRRCSSAGQLEFDEAAAQSHVLDPATGCAGWFVHPARKTGQRAIVFGHWAALEGEFGGEYHFPLDTGYSWGGRLRLMNLTDRSYLHLEHD